MAQATRLILTARLVLPLWLLLLIAGFELPALSQTVQIPDTAQAPTSSQSNLPVFGQSDSSQSASVTNAKLQPCAEAQPGDVCIKEEEGQQSQTTPLSAAQVINGSDDAGAAPNSQGPTASPAIPKEKKRIPTQASRNLFQDFVTSSIGKRLPMYGYSLFDKAPSTFAPVEQVPVPADYVIGPGDQLQVRAWGQIDINYLASVDRSGSIYLPKVGEISVAGVKYSELAGVVRTRISQLFRNFELSVSLGRLRSISIFVVGQARQPGSYTVSSLSTLVTALFACGGPSPEGSMRHIQLRRDDKLVTDFDLYDLLVKGDKSRDVHLEPGDVIFIPRIGPLAAIAGAVNGPAIYELKDSTTLDDLVKLAGGFSITAEGKRVILERVADHQVRRMEQFNLDPAGLKKTIADGDVVNVYPLNPRFENAVTLRGNVAVPGRYPWHEGMQIKDLIPDRESLVTVAYWKQLNSASKENSFGTATLSTDVKRNAPDINWEYAVIQRINPQNLSSVLIPFNLGQAIAGDASSNLELQANDVVTIFSQADIQVPIKQQRKYVRLEGEMQTAGVYEAQPGETLRHLVERVGGVSPDAYLFGSELTRESTREQQQKRLDEITERFSQDVERSAAQKSQNLTNPADAATFQAKIESQRRLAERMRTLKATGRIVLNLKPGDNSIESLPDLVLEDGDRLIVPSLPSTVSVLGAVYNQADFLYRPGRTVSDYLKQAGGVTRTADKNRAYIIRANGSVRGSTGSLLFGKGIMGERVLPGDAVVVPEQVNKTTFVKGLIDYSQIISQFALGAAAVHVLTQ